MSIELSAPQPELVLLGTGTSVGVPMIGCDCPVCTSENPRNNRTRTGAAVRTAQGTFLIDTPPELRIQLLREKIPLVHAALVTHSHADHIFGLDDLRLSGLRLDADIPLYCEESVENQLRQSFNYAFSDAPLNAHRGAIPRLTFERIGTEPFGLLGQTIRPIRLMHGKLPVLGFRINDVAFCTDVSRIPDESWDALAGLDVLVIDALRIKPHPTHFSIDQALAAVDRLKPKLAYFTHVSHYLEYEATNADLPAGVELAYDGLRIPL